jgi:flavin-dependent dehydrogenase
MLGEVGAGNVVSKFRQNEVRTMEFRQVEGFSVYLKTDLLDAPFSLAISRYALDAELVRWAIAQGAEYLDQARAVTSDVEKNHRWLRIHHPDGDQGEATLRSDVVLCGAGLQERLTKSEFKKIKRANAYRGLSAKVGCWLIAPADSLSEMAPGKLTMLLSQWGYLGIVRVEEGRINLAAAIKCSALKSKEKNLRPQEIVVEILKEAGVRYSSGLEEADWQVCPRIQRNANQVAGNRLLAIGDATGYVEPITGEGMAWAVEGAILAASHLANGWSPTVANGYQRDWESALKYKRRHARVLAQLVDSTWGTRLALHAMRAFPMVARKSARRISCGRESKLILPTPTS